MILTTCTQQQTSKLNMQQTTKSRDLSMSTNQKNSMTTCSHDDKLLNFAKYQRKNCIL